MTPTVHISLRLPRPLAERFGASGRNVIEALRDYDWLLRHYLHSPRAVRGERLIDELKGLD